MRRRLAVTVGMWLLTGVALVAADFWVEKDFTTWSDKEIQKMLTDSPWAKQVRIIVSGSLTEGPAAQIVVPEIPECGGEQFDRIQRTKVTITWSSALPIKQALIRQAIGLDAPIPAEGQQVLDRAEPFYVVTVSELPRAFAWLAGMGDALKSETMLKRKDKAPIAPVDVRLFQVAQTQSLTIMFQFPKTDAITLGDKDVELVTKLGPDEIKKKFKLADMVFADQLAL